MEVPETECELVGYTECDSTKNAMPARDDKVMISGTVSAIFGTPKIANIAQYFQFWGYQKWHFRPSKQKSETTFIDQILESVFLSISFILHIFVSFLECKIAKNYYCGFGK